MEAVRVVGSCRGLEYWTCPFVPSVVVELVLVEVGRTAAAAAAVVGVSEDYSETE